MKKITQILLLAINLTIFAQPVINSSDFDNLNLSYFSKSANSATINQGVAGANVTWDFSSLVLTSSPDNADGTNIVKVATGPFVTSFPTCNYVLKFTSITNSTPSSEGYAYFNKTATKIEQLGGSSNTDLNFSLINPNTVFVFPFSFGMSNTDTSQQDAASPIETETQTYDAYGTLITPFGTYTNVIRLKSEELGETNVSYSWIKVNPYQDIASYNTFNGINYFSFSVPPALDNEIFEISKIAIYPNPATSTLKIKLSDNSAISKITITDLSGKKILEQNGNLNTINIENLAKGLYVIDALVGEIRLVEKFIKN